LQETLDIRTSNWELQKKINKQIKVQLDTGNKSLLEMKQSQVSLLDYEIAVNEATNTLSKAREDLFSYLNIRDSGADFVMPELENLSSEQQFTTNNYLMGKLNSLKIGKLKHLETSLNFLPTISLSYYVGHNNYFVYSVIYL